MPRYAEAGCGHARGIASAARIRRGSACCCSGAIRVCAGSAALGLVCRQAGERGADLGTHGFTVFNVRRGRRPAEGRQVHNTAGAAPLRKLYCTVEQLTPSLALGGSDRYVHPVASAPGSDRHGLAWRQTVPPKSCLLLRPRIESHSPALGARIITPGLRQPCR